MRTLAAALAATATAAAPAGSVPTAAPAAVVDLRGLSIQDRIRLRALEAARA